MTALIYDIKRFAVHDGPGIRTTIFFKGCPLECWWCHNPESRNAEIECTQKIIRAEGRSFPTEIQTGKFWTVDELMAEISKDKIFMDESGGGITLSGGEPFLYSDFIEQLLDILKLENIHTAIDTTGYVSNVLLSRLASKVNLFLFDLKHMNNDLHKKYTGVSNTIILKNLKYLHENNTRMIVRYPFIPGINDGSNIDAMKNYLLNKCPDYKEIHILPYHNIASHKYRQFGIENKMAVYPEPVKEQISEVRSIFEEAGFSVKIGG